MFEKEQCIIYESAGICKVMDIKKIDIDGMSRDKLYYILEPLNMKGSKIMTPVEGNKSCMRSILTKEEANDLIHHIEEVELMWIPNEKQREENYKDALRTCDSRKWVGIIKTLYLRKQDRISQNKKLPDMDEKYLTKAKEYLYGELAVALGISKDEVEEYITSSIEEKAALLAEE